jgi:putative sigma-54 modulation protein
MITARHCELSDEEKRFIEERVNGLLRHFNRIMEAQVTVIGEKYRHKAEIKINIDHSVFFSEAESVDLKQSVEQVLQKLQRQLKKHKGRFRRRTLDKEELASMGMESLASEGEESLYTAAVTEGEIEEMSLSEAVERVRTGTASILFRDIASGRTKAVHRRDDGRIDILEMGSEDGE